MFLLADAYHCQKKQESVFIYDTKNVLKKSDKGSMIFYSTSMPVYTSWGDSITFEIDRKGYLLLHFKGKDDSFKKDTTFNKPTSFLESINYFDSDWLKKEENLSWFWDYSMYEFGGREDTMEIYLIHKITGNDSIKLEQVHRFYKPNREG